MKILSIKNRKLKASILFTIAVLSWALNTVLAKGMTNQIEPISLAFFRWFAALLFILPFGFKKIIQQKEIVKNNFGKILILSFFSISLYNSLIYYSAQFTTATNMSFTIASTPALTFVFSWIFLSQHENIYRVSGMLISLSGTIFIIFKGSLVNLFSLVVNIGDIITFLAVVSWAIYSVLFKYMRLNIEPILFLTVTIIFGLPFIAPFYIWEIYEYGLFDLNRNTIFIILFLGIFPSIISYLCWNEGVKIAGPNMASIFLYLIPLFASFIAFIFLGERIYFYHILGGIFIIGGLILYLKPEKS